MGTERRTNLGRREDLGERFIEEVDLMSFEVSFEVSFLFILLHLRDEVRKEGRKIIGPARGCPWEVICLVIC
jgi:hypothetical protein